MPGPGSVAAGTRRRMTWSAGSAVARSRHERNRSGLSVAVLVVAAVLVLSGPALVGCGRQVAAQPGHALTATYRFGGAASLGVLTVSPSQGAKPTLSYGQAQAVVAPFTAPGGYGRRVLFGYGRVDIRGGFALTSAEVGAVAPAAFAGRLAWVAVFRGPPDSYSCPASRGRRSAAPGSSPAAAPRSQTRAVVIDPSSGAYVTWTPRPAVAPCGF